MSEFSSSTRVLVLVTSLSCCATGFSADKGKPSQAQKRDEQRENEAIRKAQAHLNDVQKALKQAEDELKSAQQKATQAIAKRQAATNSLQKVLDRLEAEHAEMTGLASARKAYAAMETEFEQESEPILAELRKTTEYQALTQKIENGKASLKADDSDIDRAALARENLEAAQRLRELELAAFRRDPSLNRLLARVEQAQEEVRKASAKFEKAVERDSELKSARKAFEEAKSAQTQAENTLAKQSREVALARNNVTQAARILQQKKLADQRDTNRSKPKAK